MASIHQQPSGSWRVTWRDPIGRQRARHFDTKREARAFKAQIELDMARGSYVDGHAADRVLFRDHAARWLAGRTVERASAARDESLLRVHLLPRWGDWALPKIDHLGIQQWVAELGRRLAPATVRECYRVLSLILRSAVQARLLASNPCDGVRLPPRRRQEEPVTLTREEVIGKLLPEIPDRYRALVATAAYTGLRWGECVGLHWQAIDLDGRRLRVVRVLVEVGGLITPKPYPKSRAGRRTVPLPVPLVELLIAHREAFPSPELVFTNSIGGPVGRTSFRTRKWKPAIRRAGLPERLRFHDLRHSYATWLVSDGVPPNIVQRIMGHEDVTTTLSIYTDVPSDYVDRVDGVFEGSGRAVNRREAKFQQYVLADIERLKGRYNPTAFQVMVRQYGAVETAKRLLADPRSTSYGFGKLWELDALDASIEYAACLPWFRPLFTDDEIETAERRLADHGFPIQERLTRAAGSPPDWAVDSALTDEDER